MGISWEREHFYPEQVEALRGKLDAIVVLGENLRIGWGPHEIESTRKHLSPYSRISVLAAGLLYKAGVTDTIIFSTGQNQGYHLPSEAQAMKNHLLRIFKDIPEDAVILEEESADTLSNAKEVKKIADKYGFREVGLLAPGFHLERSNILFRWFNLMTTLIAHEDVLRSKKRRFVEKYVNSQDYQKEAEREKEIVEIIKKRGRLFYSLKSMEIRARRNPRKFLRHPL